MGVEEELKRKRTELLNSMEQLALGIETIKKQDIALPVALVKLNKSAAILKVLHEARAGSETLNRGISGVSA